MRHWFWPLLIGFLTTAGLIAGLVSEDGGDYLAWVGLGVPVAVGSWFTFRVRRTADVDAKVATRDLDADET